MAHFPVRRDRVAQARKIVRSFTVVAMATGAIPLPGASVAIVAENGAMIAAMSSELGVEVTLGAVTEALGVAGAVNVIGRAVFVEAARAMGWFAGPFGVGGIMVLGATAAGLQTWVLGELALAICARGGAPLPPPVARQVLADASASFEAARSGLTREATAKPCSTRCDRGGS